MDHFQPQKQPVFDILEQFLIKIALVFHFYSYFHVKFWLQNHSESDLLDQKTFTIGQIPSRDIFWTIFKPNFMSLGEKTTQFGHVSSQTLSFLRENDLIFTFKSLVKFSSKKHKWPLKVLKIFILITLMFANYI